MNVWKNRNRNNDRTTKVARAPKEQSHQHGNLSGLWGGSRFSGKGFQMGGVTLLMFSHHQGFKSIP